MLNVLTITGVKTVKRLELEKGGPEIYQKIQRKTSGFLMFSEGVEVNQWHKMN